MDSHRKWFDQGSKLDGDGFGQWNQVFIQHRYHLLKATPIVVSIGPEIKAGIILAVSAGNAFSTWQPCIHKYRVALFELGARRRCANPSTEFMPQGERPLFTAVAKLTKMLRTSKIKPRPVSLGPLRSGVEVENVLTKLIQMQIRATKTAPFHFDQSLTRPGCWLLDFDMAYILGAVKDRCLHDACLVVGRKVVGRGNRTLVCVLFDATQETRWKSPGENLLCTVLPAIRDLQALAP